MEEVLERVVQIASVDSTVLIQGESGTGKEIIANAIHAHSKRARGPLVKMNCAAVPETLLESELFGHEKGAFTGADRRRIGRFELAHRGTLFLDEIGELSLTLQAKLLRVLEHGEFLRVGGTKPIQVDVRIIAATNRQLADEVAAGRFRKDLYYRLQVVEIALPPLRDHKDDIPQLSAHFIQSLAPQLGVEPIDVTPAEMDYLCQYPWPGNVRELRNLIERSLILGSLNVSALYPGGTRPKPSEARATTDLHELEKRHILAVLESVAGDKTRAAQLLGISRRTLERRCAEWA
jgi:transcriptional regulator with PAS, ATPase and Fis domain